MDVLVADEVFKISLLGWIQMPIKRIDNEKKLYIFDDYKDNNKEIMISIDSFKVQEKNTFVKEEEMTWRNNLKEEADVAALRCDPFLEFFVSRPALQRLLCQTAALFGGKLQRKREHLAGQSQTDFL